LLGEALYFSGGLGCPLEYFHAGFRPVLEQRWGVSGIADYSRAVHRNRTSPEGVLAVKLFWRDIAELAAEFAPGEFPDLNAVSWRDVSPRRYHDLAELLAPLFPNPRHVHLQREDRIRQAVSAVVATDTGVWRRIPGVDDRAAGPSPDFDFERILRLIAYSDMCHGHWRNLWAALGIEPLRLSYESLTADYERSVGKLIAGLAGPGGVPPARMRRQGDGVSEAMVLMFLRENAARQAAAAKPGDRAGI
jgi:LPS sulfotransferase NodH